ncbi:hypothetical protein CTI14_45010, partial [Methylobacterium radiotolerans]
DETRNSMTADGFFRTGDIGIMDEQGYTRIVDRKKDMIAVSGFKVYPNEVEAAVAQHPGVLECAAIGVPDEHSGEAVKVFVVKKDPSLTEAQVMLGYWRKPDETRNSMTADGFFRTGDIGIMDEQGYTRIVDR